VTGTADLLADPTDVADLVSILTQNGNDYTQFKYQDVGHLGFFSSDLTPQIIEDVFNYLNKDSMIIE